MSMVARATNLSISSVSRIFNGKRQPSIAVLKSISSYLEVSVDQLIKIIDTRAASRQAHLEHTFIN